MPDTSSDLIASLQAQLAAAQAAETQPLQAPTTGASTVTLSAPAGTPEPAAAVTVLPPAETAAPAGPTLADLQAQVAALSAALATANVPQPTKAPRAMPTVGEIVSYSYEVAPGRLASRRGIVIALDPGTPDDSKSRKASINWLPDAEAELPVDDLD